jgi:predicted dehydrogenase
LAEKLRFGFIGAGGITHGHARRLLATGEAEVVAVAEPEPRSVERFRQATGLDPKVYASHGEMIAHEQLDAVLVASPHTLHFEQSRAALQAGLHVLCEKPMVCSTKEARALLDVIAATGRTFMISYQRHLERPFLWMKEQVASGALGRVTYIAAVSCQEWLYGTRGTWRQDPALSGGGQINDTGSHFIDVLTWIGGPVDLVHAFMDNRGTRVDINSAVSFRFRSGALGTFTVVGDAHSWWEDWTISGESGTIYFRNGRLFQARLGQGVREVAQEELPPSPGDVDRAFVDAVLGRREVPVPASIGLGVIQLTEAAWRSAAEGRPIRVDEL